jgi:hypothetical protein
VFSQISLIIFVKNQVFAPEIRFFSFAEGFNFVEFELFDLVFLNDNFMFINEFNLVYMDGFVIAFFFFWFILPYFDLKDYEFSERKE